MEFARLAQLFKPNVDNHAIDGDIAELDQPIAAKTTQWRQKDLALVYTALYDSRMCYLNFPSYDKNFQTLILGIDVDKNQLILDDFFPAIPALMQDHEAVLTVREDGSYANLKIRLYLSHRINIQGRSANVAHIMGVHWNEDRRQNSRVSFDKDKAPNLKLTIPMLAQLGGRVENLSSGGAKALVTGIVPKPYQLGILDKAPPVDCQISFADELDIRCKAQLRSYKIYRQPSLRASLRLCFRDISASDHNLLHTFVELGQL